MTSTTTAIREARAARKRATERARADRRAARTDAQLRADIDQRHPDGTKQCPGCSVVKNVDEFYVVRRHYSGLAGTCKACFAVRRSEWKPDKASAKARNTALGAARKARTPKQVLAKRAAMRPTGTKRCNTCHLDKDLTAFYINRTTADGLAYSCSACASLAVVAWNHSNGDAKRRIDQAYRDRRRAARAAGAA
jgi:hypothetical protein